VTYVIGGPVLAILLEIDPNVVKPGWTPLLILIGMALVMALLFRSMKRQFRRVHANFPDPSAGADGAGAEGADGTRADPTADGSTTTPGATGEEHAPSR
jgi:hypothetical protein